MYVSEEAQKSLRSGNLTKLLRVSCISPCKKLAVAQDHPLSNVLTRGLHRAREGFEGLTSDGLEAVFSNRGPTDQGNVSSSGSIGQEPRAGWTGYKATIKAFRCCELGTNGSYTLRQGETVLNRINKEEYNASIAS